MSENPLKKCACGSVFQSYQIKEIIEGRMKFCQICGTELNKIRNRLIEAQDEASKKQIYTKEDVTGDISDVETKIRPRIGIKVGEKINKVLMEAILEVNEEVDEEIEDIEEDVRDHFDEAQEELEGVKENIEDIKDRLEDAENKSKEAWEKVKEAKQENKDQKKMTKAILKAEKADRRIDKLKRKKEKYDRKIREAEKKAEYARINFTLPQEMKSNWKDLAGRLSISVSELVRTAVGSLEENLGNLEKLGDNIERSVKESGMENLGDHIESTFRGKTTPFQQKYSHTSHSSTIHNKDKIKKRIKGIIMLQKNLPIDKFAQALDEDDKFAENLIFELVGEGLLDGELEDNIFNFSNNPEEVISIFLKKIDSL